MIHSLSGTITYAGNSSLHIDVGGVEYELIASHNAVEAFAPFVAAGFSGAGQVDPANCAYRRVRILTYFHLTERGADLYGFASASERAVFLALLKVEGIGPKAACKILSHTSPEAFFTALRAHDAKALSALPGVGAKKAAKILVSLEHVFVPIESHGEQQGVGQSERGVSNNAARGGLEGRLGDIAAALCAMGYDARDAETAVRAVAQGADGSTNAKAGEKLDEALFIKQAIIELARMR